MQDFEKLGQFYLGKKYNLSTQSPEEDLLLYDARDLVTHGVCVGMTGSGKTGLCLSLLEEAAIDSIPSLVIDPKGDMANLLLTFPDLNSEEFLPWIDPDEAARARQTPEQYAEAQAALWKKGLGQWGQDGARIRKLRDSARFTLYTPGSTAGEPVALLGGFRCPGAAVLDDRESFSDMVTASATGLLGLIGMTGDPLTSRENILVSNILSHHWVQGEDVSIETLLRSMQTPPFSRLGAFDIESVFPARDRFELALKLNNLLASPGFGVWLEGAPMDVGRFLHTPEGKPKVSIFSIAHLNENERMFFVTLLLNHVVAWMRTQPGTSSLRGLVYMDEVAGYLPPVANPPSKKPLMILFKQARAFGVGVLLATQNPVDLDYKALSNAGTWFIGRLQTPQDVDRLVEGLGAESAAEQASMRQSLSALGKRVFFMKNIHEEAPEVFQTRWCLSYLRGPLTLAQIRLLAADAASAAALEAPPLQGAAPPPAASTPTSSASASSAPGSSLPSVLLMPATEMSRPHLHPEIPEYFLPFEGAVPAGADTFYRPYVCAFAEVHFPAEAAETRIHAAEAAAGGSGDRFYLNWDEAAPARFDERRLGTEPAVPSGATVGFEPPAPAACTPHSYKSWAKEYAEYLYRNSKKTRYRSTEFRIASHPEESESDFRIRVSQLAREKRDQKMDALRSRLGPKIAVLEDRIRRAEQRVEKEKGDVRQAGVQTAISFGATLLGAFLGRKKLSTTSLGRASTTMRSGVKTVKEKADIAAAEENLEALQARRSELEADFSAEMRILEGSADPTQQAIEASDIRPRKSDVRVRQTALLWIPCWRDPDGRLREAATWRADEPGPA